jgi:hypothetical protein
MTQHKKFISCYGIDNDELIKMFVALENIQTIAKSKDENFRYEFYIPTGDGEYWIYYTNELTVCELDEIIFS